MTAQAIQLGHRAIVRGTTGHTHGPITRLMPPRGHDVAWMAVADGTAVTEEKVRHGEMVVFEDGSMPIEILAHGPGRCNAEIGSRRSSPTIFALLDRVGLEQLS